MDDEKKISDPAEKPERGDDAFGITPDEVFIGKGTKNHAKVRRLKRAPKIHGKKKSLFNGADILILTVLAAVIAVAVFALFQFGVFGGGENDSGKRTIEYTVTIRNVSDTFSSAIRNGDAVYSVQGSRKLGTVCAEVEEDPSTYVVYRQTGDGGTGVLVSYPDRMNLTVTIRVTADYEEGVGYTADGVRIAVGGTYTLRFPGFTGTGTCISVENPS